MADYTLSAKITADSKDFIKGMEAAKKKAEDVSKALEQSGSSYKAIAKDMGISVAELQSKIMKLAVEYKKSGMTQADAIKKAQAELGYVKKSLDAVGDAAKATAKETNSVAEAFRQWSSLSPTVKTLKENVSSMMQAFQNSAAYTALQKIKSIAGTLTAPFKTATTAVKNAFTSVKTAVTNVTSSVKNAITQSKAFKTISSEINAIKPVCSAVAEAIKSGFQTAFSIAKTAANGFKATVEAVVSAVQGIATAASKVASAASTAFSKMGDAAQNVGSRLQSAGDAINNLGGKITAVETAAAGLATAGLKKAADSAIDFESLCS